MEPEPTRLSALLGHLKHPLRLPILVALQDEEMSSRALAEKLDASYYSVNFAVARLMEAGYVELVRVDLPPADRPGNTTRRIYRSKPDGIGRDLSPT